MKNSLSDLNNHLFEQLERLNDEDLTDEQLEKELKRADSMAKIAEKITANAEIAFKTMRYLKEYGESPAVPEMLAIPPVKGGVNFR